MYYSAQRSTPFNNLFKPVMDEIFSEINKFEHNIGKPAANILNNDVNYEIHLFVPGYEKSDFNISLKEGKITLASEKQSTGVGYKVSEFKITPFARSFTIPQGVDASEIKASYENGILKVVFQKAQETQARTIEII